MTARAISLAMCSFTLPSGEGRPPDWKIPSQNKVVKLSSLSAKNCNFKQKYVKSHFILVVLFYRPIVKRVLRDNENFSILFRSQYEINRGSTTLGQDGKRNLAVSFFALLHCCTRPRVNSNKIYESTENQQRRIFSLWKFTPERNVRYYVSCFRLLGTACGRGGRGSDTRTAELITSIAHNGSSRLSGLCSFFNQRFFFVFGLRT